MKDHVCFLLWCCHRNDAFSVALN